MPPQILILDGGLGTSLEDKYSVKFSAATPLWSSSLLITDPATLLFCQQDFGEIPVDIVLTATYQASIAGFANTKTPQCPHGVPPVAIPAYLDGAVRIAELVKSDEARVALSLGPYGACMVPSQEYSGEYDAAHSSGQALQDWHYERIQLFLELPNLPNRLGYVAMETVPRLDEIIAMRKALHLVPDFSDLPFWISVLSPGEANVLPDGSPIEDAVKAMLDPKVSDAVPWGIGINCTKVWKLDSLLRIYEATICTMIQQERITEWPALVLYPDGTNGEVYNTTTQTWELPERLRDQQRVPWEVQLAEIVRATQERGKWRQIVVGGCCKSTCDDIKRLRKLLLA